MPDLTPTQITAVPGHAWQNRGTGTFSCACGGWSVRESDLSTDEERASNYGYRLWERHVQASVEAKVYALDLKYARETAEMRRQETSALAFRQAWHAANRQGLKGHRVEAGLQALIQLGWTPPGDRHPVADVDPSMVRRAPVATPPDSTPALLIELEGIAYRLRDIYRQLDANLEAPHA